MNLRPGPANVRDLRGQFAGLGGVLRNKAELPRSTYYPGDATK